MKATRKIMTLVLAVVLTFSLAAPAFADITAFNKLGQETNMSVKGTINLPTINIVVPTAAEIVVNPYGLSYTLEGETEPSTDTLIAAKQVITNISNVKIKLTAKVAGTVAGEAKLAEESNLNDAKDDFKDYKEKGVFMKVGVAYIGTNEATADTLDKVDITKCTGDNQGANKVLTATPTALFEDGKEIIFADAIGDNNEIDESKATNAVVVISGLANGTLDEGKAWTSADKVGATIAFTFTMAAKDATASTAISLS